MLVWLILSLILENYLVKVAYKYIPVSEYLTLWTLVYFSIATVIYDMYHDIE